MKNHNFYGFLLAAICGIISLIQMLFDIAKSGTADLVAIMALIMSLDMVLYFGGKIDEGRKIN